MLKELYNTLIQLNSVESTNTFLKEIAKEDCESGTVIIANSQTAGRGRYEKSFLSPEGGLYLSYLYKIDKLTDELSEITKWSCVSVYRAIDKICGIKCQLKYVNDLLYNGKKLCGILTELSENNLIIGIGINVNTDLSLINGNLNESATSLKEVTGKDTDLNELAIAIIDELNKQFEEWPTIRDRIDFYNQNVLIVHI